MRAPGRAGSSAASRALHGRPPRPVPAKALAGVAFPGSPCAPVGSKPQQHLQGSNAGFNFDRRTTIGDVQSLLAQLDLLSVVRVYPFLYASV